MSLDDGDKLWIVENLPTERAYQMTYMVGPINVTVRLSNKNDVVPAIEEIVKQARDSKVLNAKVEIPTPQKQAEVEASHPKAKCETCGAEMAYKTGIGKKGKWEALMCPNSVKGDRVNHKPVWL
jgi:hypothetical protein